MDSSSSDSQNEQPFNKKYLRLQKIAEGSYGVVWKGKNSETGEFVAIKKFKNVSNEGLPVSAVREIHILKKIKSSFVLPPLQLSIKTQSVCMVTQWKDLSLNKIIKKAQNYNVKNIMGSIFKAVQSVHDHYIMHRDLKPANIVLDNPEGQNLKLIDFGMAKQIKWNPNLSQTNQVGTLYYRAPQLLMGSTKYDKSIDIWACGCIFYELLTTQVLFKADSETQQLVLIYQNVATLQDIAKPLQNGIQISSTSLLNWQKIITDLNNKANEISLLKGLLRVNPKERMSIKEALSHPYFTEE